jgi:hypothetical protein
VVLLTIELLDTMDESELELAVEELGTDDNVVDDKEEDELDDEALVADTVEAVRGLAEDDEVLDTENGAGVKLLELKPERDAEISDAE